MKLSYRQQSGFSADKITIEKRKAMTNWDIAEQVFEYLKRIGFRAYRFDFCDDVVKYGGIEDSVIHFRVKGVNRHWQFAMWLYEENYDDPEKQNEPLIYFFCQWDNQIDKFKPSRSPACVEISVTEFKCEIEEPDCDFWHIRSMLEMLKAHPIICYCGFCGDNASFTSQHFLKFFIECESRYYFTAFKRRLIATLLFPYFRTLVWLTDRAKHVAYCDMEKTKYINNRDVYYDSVYEISCVFKKEATDEQMYRTMKKYKKMQYGQYSHFRYVIDINYFRQEGTEGIIDYEFD